MARKRPAAKATTARARAARPSALLDTRIIYCGDCLDRLAKLPAGCVDRVYLWHRFPTGDSNSNRNYEVFWGDTKERRGSKDKLVPQDPNHEPASVLLDRIRANRDANCMRTAGTAVRPRRKSRSNSRG